MTHPAVRELFESLGRHSAFTELVRKLERSFETPGAPQKFSLSGLTSAAKALYLVLLYQSIERPLVVVVDGNRQAETLTELIGAFWQILNKNSQTAKPQILPALDVIPSQNLSPHSDLSAQRAVALWRMATQHVPITITPVAAALLRVESRDFYRHLALTLRTGDEVALEDVMAHLRSIGFERRDPVDMVGEY
ncbi:MAG: transcription-repair coupling factor, partial [Bryobacteraceae bacterium]|nr:transcription-repair coupling factor [Bryobacteraceae bacterium]